MKIVIINHSDTLGGASVVSFRLMEALRQVGADARMLVGHKNSSSPFVEEVGHRLLYKAAFLGEHAEIFLSNGMSRSRLFQVSTARFGLPLASHPLVEGADAVVLGWVNQGLLSLDEAARIARSRPVVWVMHDMWNLTGICHHAATCRRWEHTCGDCPLLGSMARSGDLSRSVHRHKASAYSSAPFTFVAVSSWLQKLAAESSLLATAHVELIPNPFPVEQFTAEERTEENPTKIILMGAARLDDPVKGLSYAIEALNILNDRGYGGKAKAVFFGALRDATALDSLRLPYEYIGTVDGREALSNLFSRADIVLSSSLYETLPGTLVEGQAAGCYPVTFGRGGQRDIITHASTGYIVPDDNGRLSGSLLADGLEYALTHPSDRRLLRESVMERFSSKSVARRYLSLLEALIEQHTPSRPH